jgi:hypothetical protein
MLRLLPTAALAFALLAPAAHADVVATTAKPTPLAAADGKVLYSAWDGSQYRLTQLGAGALNVAGADAPFVADIGRTGGHTVAVYARDRVLYEYDFATKKERRLLAGTAGSVSGDRLVFARKSGVYERRGSGRSERLTRKEALSVDTRGSRFAFSGSRKWSHEPWLGTTRLTHVPGGGASPDFLDALNPTFSGNSIYWLLSRQGDNNFGEIHRYNRAERRDERVNMRIDGIVAGFAYDRGNAYYSVGTEIHRVSGLAFEPAPRITMPL